MAGVFLFAQQNARVTFEWARLESFTEWYHWPLLAAVCAALVAYVVWMYRKDSVELRRPVGALLTLLRIAAFAGLLAIFLEPQWRTERDVVRNSRAMLLVDTSLSMGLNDNETPSVQAGPNRSQQVAAALSAGKLLDDLRNVHDVVVLRFDQDLSRIASMNRLPSAKANASPRGREQPPERIDWEKMLAPRGSETRIGQALRQIIHDERTGPLSGIIVMSDGGQNAGIEPASAVALAREAKIPVYTVGIGSDRQPVNVRVADLLAPARAYPGDDYTVTAYIQAQGMAGQTVKVELLSQAGQAPANGAGGQVEASENITLGAEGEAMPIKFELTPEETGQRALTVRVQPPVADGNPRDNSQTVDIEVVDRKTRVLLLAGGPTREYVFLRNLLFRDKEITVDVLLQSAQGAISQEAASIREEFPSTREELYEYDCIVAFDPDWEQLDADQIELLESWVAEQAGGLIAIAGPVYMDRWAQRPAMSKVRGLYPVEFHRRFAMLDDGRFGSTEPWPIDFSRDGMDAEFLWLDDSAPASRQAWESFPGVYGYYAVRGPKPGATVYGYYSDPRAADGEKRPVYMAGQFFGSGRVFYLGSGEMWRLRGLDESYFEQFYTKLLRHVSQGRLLRGSNRGVLLVERDRYLLGNSVAVRAQLNNAQLEPLDVPSVPLEIVLPDGALESLILAPAPGSLGTYTGQFTVYQEGSYGLSLPVPESKDETLNRRIQVRVPDLERERPQRNDALLSEIARDTGGKYYVGLDAALDVKAGRSLAMELPDRRKILPVLDSPDREWEQQWLGWMMGAICGFLCLEWLIRRLARMV